MLTGTVIDRLLTYDPETGKFTRKRGIGGQPAGTIAGHLQTSIRDGHEVQYWVLRIKGNLYLLHRVAWAFMRGKWVPEVDHRDGDSTNNIFSNLRECTHSQNMQNAKKRSDNKSGFKGVSWDSINQKWVVRIRIPNGGYENLGRFDDAEEGHQSYCRRAKELYGDFARFG
jgi:hypothetical protein